MDYNAAIPGFARQRGSVVTDPFGLPSASDTWHLQPHVRPKLEGAEAGGLEEPIWQLTLRHSHDDTEEESGRYPERPGELDCVYYMRTGLCGYGMSCRFNHPPNRKMVMTAARNRDEYPERIGQPECQYYVKTGTCKFGPTCKFDHPMETSSYTLVASSPVDIPVARHTLGSSSTALTPSMSSEFTVERVVGRSKEYASTSEVHQQSSSGDDLEANVQRTTSSSIVESTLS